MNNTPYYKDPSVKAAGVVENYTQEQVQEYIRCSQDPTYFIEKYIQVNTIDKGLVPLNLRPYQKNIIESVHNNRHSVILSGRQSGKTITISSYILWYVFFNADKTVAILANKGAVAREILSKIVTAYKTIPFFLQPGATTFNKGSIELGNNSRIIASSTSSSSIRGFMCVTLDSNVTIKVNGEIRTVSITELLHMQKANSSK